MLMLGIVTLHQLHKVGIKITQWYVMVLMLLKLYNNIIVDGIDLMILIAQYISNLLVQTVLKLEHLLVHYLTIVVASIKLGTTHVLHKAGQSGQQQVTTVHQILQPVLKLESIGL
jgi:hypothetical protein